MLNACVMIKAVPTRLDAILEAVKKMKEVKKAYLAYGRFDVVAFVELEGYHDVMAFSTRINALDGVRSTETLVEA